MKQIKRGNLIFNVREDTLDEWVVDEVLNMNMYMKPLDIKRGDIVLDIGMNIGAFSLLASFFGGKVIGFEPDIENFDIAYKNLLGNGFNATLYREGVSDMDKMVRLYLNEKKNRGQHTTTFVAGRRWVEIVCRDINRVLLEHRPTKVKIDCEGEEYKIIKAVKDWLDVKAIVFEYHRKILRDEENVKFNEIVGILEKDFIVNCKRDGKGWTQIIKAIRK